MQQKLRLGINIDHVATIRNARGGLHPDPVRAALQAAAAGADGITAHLREDRRHISDTDISRLSEEIALPLNLEMAATPEMLEIALRHKPNAACLVPEKRNEVTTEGGLNVLGSHNHLRPYIQNLLDAQIRVSLFIDPQIEQVQAAKDLGATIVELHTGAFCEAWEEDENGEEAQQELTRLKQAADMAVELGVECHAGHGITYDSVKAIAAIPPVVELNIGHFLVGEAIFVGLEHAITTMRKLMDDSRQLANTSLSAS